MSADGYDSVEEERLVRERIEASEKDRQKRRKEREQSKKDRRRRVEKIIDRPLPVSQDDKLKISEKKIFDELEKREKLLDEKLESLEKRIVEDDKIQEQIKEVEEKLVNDFIKKLAEEQYQKIDKKLKELTSKMNNRIDDIAKDKTHNVEHETKVLKEMLLSLQSKINDLEVVATDNTKYKELKEEMSILTNIVDNDMNTNIEDIREKLKKMDEQNVKSSIVDKKFQELENKITKELNQDNRINDIMQKISQLENLKVSTNGDDINFQDMLDDVISKLEDTNDKRMEVMYREMRKRINKLEKSKNNNDGEEMQERLLVDLEKRLSIIENFKKKRERDEKKIQKRGSRLTRSINKKSKIGGKKKKKDFTSLKNQILQKHNLGIVQEEEDDIEIEVEDLPFLDEVDFESYVDPYLDFYERIKTRGKSGLLRPATLRDIDNLQRELNRKNDRLRNKMCKQMVRYKNEMTREKNKNRAYGRKRGEVIMDEKEYELVKIFKKFECLIKNRFANEIKIYFEYMHDFNFTFENKETKQSLSIYYDSKLKVKCIIVSYKKRFGNALKNFHHKFKIGDIVTMTLGMWEDGNGEHFRVKVMDNVVDFDEMFCIKNIESNCFYEIQVEFNDEELFDI